MLRDITVGRYIKRDSIIHRADARTKLVCTVLYSAAAILCDSPFSFAVLAAFTAAAVFAARLPMKYVIKGIKPIRWFILFTVIMNLFLTPGNVLWQLGALRITDAGAAAAALTAVRLALFITTAGVLTLTTSPTELTDGFAGLMSPLKHIKFPVEDIAMIMSIALRFIPILADEAVKIQTAQRARGGGIAQKGIKQKIYTVVPIVIPLFVAAFRRAEDLADAMDARCWGMGTRRPCRRAHIGKPDAAIAAASAAAVLLLAAAEMLFRI